MIVHRTCAVTARQLDTVLQQLGIPIPVVQRILTLPSDQMRCRILTDLLIDQGATAATRFRHLNDSSTLRFLGIASISEDPEVLSLHLEVTRVLGTGKYGSTVLCQVVIPHIYSARVAVKSGKIYPHEFALQKKFWSKGLAPRPIAERTHITQVVVQDDVMQTTHTQYLTFQQLSMEEIDGTLRTWMLDDSRQVSDIHGAIMGVRGILNQLHRHRYTHGDMHISNVGYRRIVVGNSRSRTSGGGGGEEKKPSTSSSASKSRYGSELTLLDFALANTMGAFRLVEMIQLLRSAMTLATKARSDHNRRLQEIRDMSREEESDLVFFQQRYDEEVTRFKRRLAVIRDMMEIWAKTWWGDMWTEYPRSMSILFSARDVNAYMERTRRMPRGTWSAELDHAFKRRLHPLIRKVLTRTNFQSDARIDLNNDHVLSHVLSGEA